VKGLIDERLATVRVLDSPTLVRPDLSRDRDTVAARLRALIARGDYPPGLWN